MKHPFLHILLACTLLTSCDIEMASDNELDANWQLREIDTLATEGTADMARSNIYWAIEGDILQVRNISTSQKFLLRLQKDKDQLTVSNPYHVHTKDSLTAVENDSLLAPLGINGTKVSYHIDQLNHSHLTLADTLLRLHFRRY
ncbi:MAG: lipocalin-like domain-containing protein [Bacteroidaceae bacterium]|nr:lipocalin-like domain-containing protein [Bacteroidaceae bacterium]